MSKTPIPYARQCIDQADIDAVSEILRSDWLTQGPAVERFEQATAHYCGAAYAVAVCNATSALHLACRALEVGPGDTVWTSPNTFAASANCSLYCGGSVDFVDIDPQTLNMSPALLAEKLKAAKAQGRLPKVVIPVHFGGQPCHMDEISGLARQYGFRVVEDASHAVGADYRGAKTGSCSHSDITVFSFHPVKIMTTGEGGMLLTNDPELARRLRLLRSHGITRDPRWMESESEGAWYYQQIDLGLNYRLTDIHAALGASQLMKVDRFVARRRQLAGQYDEGFRGMHVRPAIQSEGCHSAYHLYVIQLETEKIAHSRRAVFDRLRAGGINVNVHYIPVHTQPYYQRLGFKREDFPNAVGYYERALSLPLYYGLTDEELRFVIDSVAKALQ